MNRYISVIVTVFNTSIEDFNAAINSINFDCELIVVNDCSLLDFKYEIPRMRYGSKYINLSSRHGILHARRIGVENATGGLIIFLDSDDEFKSDMQHCTNLDDYSYDDDINPLEVTESCYDENVKDPIKHLKLFIRNDRSAIQPYVTNIIWNAEFLKRVMENLKGFPNVSMGEDTVIMIMALSMRPRLDFNTDKIYNGKLTYYNRKKPHTCNKLSADSTIGDIQEAWNLCKPFRDSIEIFRRNLNYISGLDDRDFTYIKYRISTCKLRYCDPRLVSQVVNSDKEFADIDVSINVDTIKKSFKIMDSFINTRYHICMSCMHYDNDSRECDYESCHNGCSRYSAIINSQCFYRESDNNEFDKLDDFVGGIIPETEENIY